MFLRVLGITLIVLIVFLFLDRKEKFCDTDCQVDISVINHLKNVVKTIAPEIVNYEILPGKESVTVNKEKIYICLRDPKTKGIYSFEILLYVTLHELAHVLSSTYSTKSHNTEFQNNFSKLLKRAYEKNFLPPNTVIPDDYCKPVSPPFWQKFLDIY
jgi:WLM domain.